MKMVARSLKNLFLIVFFMLLGTHSYAVLGRIMIFAMDQDELKILLAPHKSYWSDWGKPVKDAPELSTFQADLTRELALQPVNPHCEETVTLADGTLVYAKEVQFKPASKLYPKIITTTDKFIKKADLVWVSTEEIKNLDSKKPKKFKTKSHNLEISRGITNNLDYVLTQANNQKQSQGESFPSTPSIHTPTTATLSFNQTRLPSHIPTPVLPANTQFNFGISTLSTNWNNPKFIKFYNKNAPYYEFTNFWVNSHPRRPLFTEPTRVWYSSEHYYQAHKFIDGSPEFNQILTSTNPREIFNLGQVQSRNRLDTATWKSINLHIMLDALLYKFAHNYLLAQILLSTTGKVLVEDAGANDAFFGAGADYNGKNHLGRMLMFIRSKLEQGANLVFLVKKTALIQEYNAIPEGPAGIITYCSNIK